MSSGKVFVLKYSDALPYFDYCYIQDSKAKPVVFAFVLPGNELLINALKVLNTDAIHVHRTVGDEMIISMSIESFWYIFNDSVLDALDNLTFLTDKEKEAYEKLVKTS